MDNLASILASLLGVFVGIFYAFSGFADPGEEADIQERPRIKNFFWIGGGAVAVVLVDWNIFEGTPLSPEARGMLMFWYFLAAVLTALILIIVISVFVALQANARQKAGKFEAGTLWTLLGEYWHYGFPRYTAKRNEIEAGVMRREVTAELQASIPEEISAICASISTTMQAVHNEAMWTNTTQREQHVDNILKAMESTIKVIAREDGDLKLNSNYMIALPKTGVAGKKVLFEEEDRDPQAYLELARYASGETADVLIPVAKGRSKLLPGAPTAFVKRGAAVINCKNPVFESEVTEPIRAAIRQYFAGATYASVLSVPLIWEREVVGVANIESSKVDLLGRNADILAQIALALSPFCLMLGEAVHRSRK